MKYLITAILLIVTTGCFPEFPASDAPSDKYLNEFEYKGHTYIHYELGRRAGITHDMNCECMPKPVSVITSEELKQYTDLKKKIGGE